MAQALTSQMNIRIDASLKQRGDAALGRMGYTASEAIRAVWSLAASGTHGMDALRDVLAKGMAIARAEAHEATLDGVSNDDDPVARLKPWELFDYYAAKLGEGYEVAPATFSDDELLEMETFDRMREKGLL